MSIVTIIGALLGASIRMMTPLLLVAIGELYSERAGMMNIGLDGIMGVGTIAGFIAASSTGSPWLGLLAGIAAGMVFNMIYAFCTITIRAGQVINGMALNILGAGLVIYIYRSKYGITNERVTVDIMKNVHIPGLSDIPIIGEFFSASPLTYIAVLLVVFTWFFFYRTRLGNNFMAVGEYPRAAETMGINVIRTKYIACLICGALAGLGGAFLTTCYVSSFSEGLVAGRGFIALSAVIFGGWTPYGVLTACAIFGFVDALQLRLQAFTDFPYQLLALLPYLITLLALVFMKNRGQGPKANAKEYYREGHV